VAAAGVSGIYNLFKFIFFGSGVSGSPVCEPGPKILGGPAGAPKNGPSGVLPTTILGAPVEML
jgi:hypothetical protein